ncbi:hypothetical protein [Streptococcus macacae]|uniref:Bacteriocin BlpK n=1 Tax=Streptococcus macacae NCTC 11558 TaxID=764298 RepID=G5JXF3_9STRE|nr:hypothetical protein [Streptococcus macacae]EHJ52499.1 bacteriocin BlpK [Streptococcus macacae NCTC 11558]SUN79213.1 Uncharacterised protein [Streptococcus macacae NCTC 11558]
MIKAFDKFEMMDNEALATIEGAAAAVGIGALGGAIKGAVQTGTWQGAALKGVGYGIKGGLIYGATYGF